MIEIPREDAYILRRLLSELMDLDSRARCSDKFFRTHFTDYIKTMRAAGTIDRLDRQLAQIQESDPPKATKVRKKSTDNSSL